MGSELIWVQWVWIWRMLGEWGFLSRHFRAYGDTRLRNLYSTFITPWSDQSAARTVEPDFHLPTCYSSVQAPPPGPNKATAFSDETLFFMFYSSPKDALQEVAAQELCVMSS
jgi:hypothetical protein